MTNRGPFDRRTRAEYPRKEWRVTLDGLRHSHASHMLASNIHPKIVQERLGHSSIAITMDIYSHEHAGRGCRGG